jgi:Spy/CpxP family protein refolding chaperone
MKKLLVGLSIVLVAAVWMIGWSLFFNSIALADEGGHRGHHHCLFNKLNLTDDQKKEMFTIRLDERAKIKPMFQKLKEGRNELRSLPKGQFDEAKVRSIAKRQSDIIADIIVEKARMKSRMYAVLTPEQRTRAEQMHDKWKAGHEKKHEQKD